MIKKQFSKHYKRLEEDLKQIQGLTPVVFKLISINLKNLEQDIENIIQEKKERDNEEESE